MGPGGGIVLGIDYARRIVYWGDTDISSYLSGIGATNENHINNTDGTINNDASKLIANVLHGYPKPYCMGNDYHQQVVYWSVPVFYLHNGVELLPSQNICFCEYN